MSLDSSRATLSFHAAETVTGETSGSGTVPASDWAFADCRTTPFPGTPDRTRVCLRGGFDAARVYELVYTAKDPKVLGLGLAATRDIVSFFRHRAADDHGTPNPVANLVRFAVAIGTSQSGNFIKTAIHLGFNEDLSGRRVWDGVFPYIAARQTPLNFRFAAPGGAGTLYEPGSEPVLWWGTYADTTRGRPAASLLDRCTATQHVPQGDRGVRLDRTLESADVARPRRHRRRRPTSRFPTNVRRYYMPGTTHGGGRGRLSAGPRRRAGGVR